MHTRSIAALVAASLLAAAPGVAIAGKRDTARTALADAKAKLDMNERNGITGAAADVQARARTALDKAQKSFDDSQENAASTQKQQAAARTEAAVAGPTPTGGN